jgi:uncharacterized lipoprotein YbaY
MAMLADMKRTIPLLLALVLAVPACGGSDGSAGPSGSTGPSGPAVTGTVSYLPRIAMPPKATIDITVNDISKQDGGAVVIGEQTISDPGEVPVAFSVSYDPGVIVDTDTYAVTAVILRDGTPWMSNTDVVPVITSGNPTSGVDVIVEPVVR